MNPQGAQAGKDLSPFHRGCWWDYLCNGVFLFPLKGAEITLKSAERKRLPVPTGSSFSQLIANCLVFIAES
jgi:hypothetical protein